MMGDDPFADFDEETTSQPMATSEPAPQTRSYNTGTSGGRYANEIYSEQVLAEKRKFFIDVKESSNGKFVKISEKSHGRKSTIMMDAADVPAFITALQNAQAHF